MFSFTAYYNPALLGLHDQEDVVLSDSEKSPISIPPDMFLSAYIHGEAETLAEYDIPSYISGEISDIPEQDCIMELDEHTYKCVLIQWNTENLRPSDTCDQYRHRGLLCLKTDQKSIDYARKCSKEKTEYL